MNDTLYGKKISFNYQNIDFGKEMRVHQSLCGHYVANANATVDQLAKCRFAITSPTCKAQIENSCQKSGLSDIIKNTKISNPLPRECDNLRADYDSVNCFNWINARIFRNTMSLRVNQLDSLSLYIASQETTPEKITTRRLFLRELTTEALPEPAKITLATQQQVQQMSSLASLPANLTFTINVEGSTDSFVADTNLTTIDIAALANETTIIPSSASSIFVSLISLLLMAFMI
jgi:hypothetical protein